MSGLMFRPDLAAAVMDGRKTVTRRIANDRPRSPWFHGRQRWPDTIAVQPGRAKTAIGRARIVSTVLEPLGELSDREAWREGFESADAFEAGWVAINGGEYDPMTLVWRVELEAIR